MSKDRVEKATEAEIEKTWKRNSAFRMRRKCLELNRSINKSIVIIKR